MKNMPKELIEGEKTNYEAAGCDQLLQSVEEIMRIIQEAKTPGEGSKLVDGQATGAGSSGPDDIEADLDSEVDNSGEYLNPF